MSAALPTVSPWLVDRLGEMLGEGGGAARPLAVLSDEEIAALDSGVDDEFSVCPWLDAHPTLDADLAAQVGRRSLMLRGLLTLEDDPLGGATTRPSELLTTVGEARRTGTGWLRATATSDGVRTGWLGTLQPRHGIFEEEVDREGMHYLTACTYADGLDRLTRWTVPVDGSAPGGSMRLDGNEWPAWLANELGVEARQVVLDVYLPHLDEAGRAHRWLLAHDDRVAVLAVLDPADPGGLLLVSPTSPEVVAREIGSLVADALADVGGPS